MRREAETSVPKQCKERGPGERKLRKPDDHLTLDFFLKRS